jgi:tRNA1(Val) A37 N6-methylase TrmN6
VWPTARGLPAQLEPGEEVCALAGRWGIYQHVALHRYSTDDVVTAWAAWRAGEHLLRPALARRGVDSGVRCALDIGCGIGSVMLMTAWLHPTAACVGLEAQPARAARAARSVRLNLGDDGGGGRVAVAVGDLRDAAVSLPPLPQLPSVADAPAGARPAFDLVTGTPPYFDLSAGGPPGSEESARCLFEYRGGIEAYCEAGARHAAPGHGLFVVVETALALTRSYAAAAAAGLRVLARLDVVPVAGKPPLINVFVMCHAGRDSAYAFPVAPCSDAVEAGGELGGVAVGAALFAPGGRSPYGEDADAVWGPLPDEAEAPPAQVPPSASVAGHGTGVVEGAPAAAAGAAAAHDGAPHPRAARRVRKQACRPYPGAMHGELVHTIVVRGADGRRTREYQALLRDLGKKGGA